MCQGPQPWIPRTRQSKIGTVIAGGRRIMILDFVYILSRNVGPDDEF